jgi:hypothetical protein
MSKWLRILALGSVLAAIGACAKPGASTQGVYMLLDTSGTYTQELEKAQHIINFVLSKLNPGDSFAVARIDTASFSEKDIVAKVAFADQPSRANQEKRLFRDTIDGFVKTVRASPYTDITGGMLQATEYLTEANTGRKVILIFSDLQEDLKSGYVRNLPFQLENFDVVALNVTKLRSDNVDPREYQKRLEHWRQRVESGGGRWRVINDLERLEPILK